MNTHNIELPPLPKPAMNEGDTAFYAAFAGSQLTDYARAAIELYQRRIAELESQLEAIGAGGVSARRITSAPSNASAKITERSQAYLDGNLDADEHAAFIKWAREAHDYPEYARLILDSEWCQGAVAGWQGAVEAARQRGGEPVGFISGEFEQVNNGPGVYYLMGTILIDDIKAIPPAPGARLYTAPQPAEPRLDAPAQVGPVRFGIGVKWSNVIRAAQRHHEYMRQPEQEQARMKKFGEAIKAIQAAQPSVPEAVQQDVPDADSEEYQTLNDCEGVELESSKPFRFACCDCGLVHDVVIVSEDENPVGFAVKRNTVATRERRDSLGLTAQPPLNLEKKND